MDGDHGVDIETGRLARLNAAAMYALVESGALHDRRVEMIEGMLIEMAPSSDPHGLAFGGLARVIGNTLSDNGWRVLADAALYLADDLMLAPDITVLPEGVVSHEAKGADVALAIEIADTTLAYDLGTKARLYAAQGVADYWVVDLPNRRLHIHREPGPEGYASIAVHPWGSTVAALCAPDLTLVLPETLTQ